MAVGRTHPSDGFSLVELLVAISLIAILIAVLLPAVNASRHAARTAICASSQRQIMVAWESVMIDRAGDIPLTRNTSSKQPQWWQLTKFYIDSARYESGADQPIVYPCPEVASRYDKVFYNTLSFGYSANTRWTLGSPASPGNERQQWANVMNPSRYPWLADGWVITPILVTRSYVGYADDPGDDEWGVGFYHARDSTVAAFADGHAKSVSRNQVAVVESGEPTWFLNR